MYQRATPLFDDVKEPQWDDSVDACNPANIDPNADDEEEFITR